MAAQFVMLAVVYGVGNVTRMIKKRKNMFTVRVLAAITEKKNFERHRSPKKYHDFEPKCHILALNTVTYVIPYR